MGTQLVWFKRDLRISDHAPLYEASKRGPCVCLYIYEPDIIAGEDFDASHLDFINESLASLDAALRSLGGQLITRVGTAVSVMGQLHETYNFDGLFSHEETGNDLTYKRDIAVGAWAKEVGLPWHEFRQFGVIRRLKSRDGWSRLWNQQMGQQMLPAPHAMCSPDASSDLVLHLGREFGLGQSRLKAPQKGGIEAAHDTLKSFLSERGESYQWDMSAPSSAERACSRLSTYIAYGNISIRNIHQALTARRQAVKNLKATGRAVNGGWLRSLSSFDKRLHWHCHFVQKLESQPSIEWENMATAYDGLREDDFNHEWFERWCQGQTGYPMVDACMRYLHHTGWINFRMRAMLVSFASYHLWLDWRPTSRFLARQFLDYEPGIHYPQVQMQSGTTGINSIRIYSPTKQVQDHDPHGHFIRRWVPELEAVPDANIAEPFSMSIDDQNRAACRIGVDYPAPLVDHRVAVNLAKQRIYSVRRQIGAKVEASKVFTRHGSRKGPSSPRPRSAKTEGS